MEYRRRGKRRVRFVQQQPARRPGQPPAAVCALEVPSLDEGLGYDVGCTRLQPKLPGQVVRPQRPGV